MTTEATETAIASARAAGLRYSSDKTPGITRIRRGAGFVYRDAGGRLVRDNSTLNRIRKLVLPPAWRRVWISADPRAHLQATGLDAANRKQYRYHPDWTAERDATKYHRMLAFAKALPSMRRRVARDMRKPPLSRPRVLATVFQLLERTSIRIGNEQYARTNKSHGLTTLRDRHVKIRGRRLHFEFRAKSGVHQAIDVNDARLARAVRQCQDLPGQTLFQYVDDGGAIRSLTSADVNEYLHEISGGDFTAKDFRTWAGTVTAARSLEDLGVTDEGRARERTLVAAIDQVAEALGNTRAVCRRCYIHPAVMDAYLAGVTIGRIARRSPAGFKGLRQLEACVVKLLQSSALKRAA